MHPTHNSFWWPSFSRDGLIYALVLYTDKPDLLRNCVHCTFRLQLIFAQIDCNGYFAGKGPDCIVTLYD